MVVLEGNGEKIVASETVRFSFCSLAMNHPAVPPVSFWRSHSLALCESMNRITHFVALVLVRKACLKISKLLTRFLTYA